MWSEKVCCLRKNLLEVRKHPHDEPAEPSSRLIVMITLVCPIRRLGLRFSDACPVAMTAAAIPIHNGGHLMLLPRKGLCPYSQSAP